MDVNATTDFSGFGIIGRRCNNQGSMPFGIACKFPVLFGTDPSTPLKGFFRESKNKPKLQINAVLGLW